MTFIRISLGLIIAAALAVATLGYLHVSQQIPQLEKQRGEEKDAKELALTKLNNTNKVLVATRKELATTQQDLAETKTQRDKAVATAAVQQKRANDLADKLAQATTERDDARNQLAAYTTTGLTAEQVTKLNKNLHDAEAAIQAMNEEKVVLLTTITRLTNELAKYIGPETDIKLPAGLRGKIEVVDPKWEFVVLNVGVDQGVITGGELLVSREGKLVAKVVVRSTDKGRSIANLVPGWNFGQIVEGDEVSPAHPQPAS